MTIAFLGAGNMGEPMARNLLRAGHQLRIFNRTRARAAPLEQAGAAVAASASDAVRGADVLITMLANDDAVRETLLGAPAAIDALGRDAIHISASTISVRLSKELAREHERRGQLFVAAPVLGRPEAAAAKRLWIIAAGPRAAIDRCAPIFDAVGRGVSVVGEQPWQANVAKIAVNFTLAAAIEAMGEATALMRKSDVEPRVFMEVLNALFGSPVYENYGRMIADRAFEPAGFRVALGLKDVSLALDASHDAAVPMPIAGVLRDQFLSAIAHGLEDADWSAVSETSARNAGLDRRPLT
jgi:3-hydroxyisobutyrate dehydrogenase-like beta-hydroxyacid dehydrogenase